MCVEVVRSLLAVHCRLKSLKEGTEKEWKLYKWKLNKYVLGKSSPMQVGYYVT